MAELTRPLAGQVAVVTGASGGLGRAIALALAAAGADLVLTARNATALEAVSEQARAAGVRTLVHAADLTRSAEAEALAAAALQAFGKIDVLVNNAGTQVEKPLLEVTDAEWQQVMDVNLNAVFYCIRAAGRHMVGRGGGRVINIGSVAAGAGVPWEVAYAASKGGIVALTRSLAAEWARHQVQVNAVCPGYLSEGMPGALIQNPESLQRLLRRVPQRRLGQPAEVAAMVVFLATPGAAFITGSIIYVDGGYTAV